MRSSVLLFVALAVASASASATKSTCSAFSFRSRISSTKDKLKSAKSHYKNGNNHNTNSNTDSNSDSDGNALLQSLLLNPLAPPSSNDHDLRVERHLEQAVRVPRKSRKAKIKKDEKVIFFPTAARRSEDGTSWSVPIHGWIFEPETRDPARR